VKLWDFVVQMHRDVDWNTLVVFYGVIGALICFAILHLLPRRARAIAEGVRKRVGEHETRLNQTEARLRQSEERFDQGAERLNEAEDRITQRLDEKTQAIVENVLNLEARLQGMEADVEALRTYIEEVGGCIPAVREELEEFRNSLSKTFRGELDYLLGTFRDALGSALEQVKTDLHAGIERVDALELLIESCGRAERALLRTAEGTAAEFPIEGDTAERGREEPASPAPGTARSAEDFGAEGEAAGQGAETAAEDPQDDAAFAAGLEGAEPAEALEIVAGPQEYVETPDGEEPGQAQPVASDDEDREQPDR